MRKPREGLPHFSTASRSADDDPAGDTVTALFSATLFSNKLSGSYDFVLTGTASEEAFNIDLTSTKNTYQITGYDTGTFRDKLVLLGATGAIQ